MQLPTILASYTVEKYHFWKNLKNSCLSLKNLISTIELPVTN